MQVIETEPGTRWTATDGPHHAQAFLGRIHRTYGWLEVEGDVPPTAVRELAAALSDEIGMPLLAKAVPGTPRHGQLTAAGATAYQTCPPSEVDGSRPDNARWAATEPPPGVRVVEVTDLSDAEVLDHFVRLYVWVHAGWGPVTDEGAVRDHFGPLLAEALDRELSVVSARDEQVTALGYAVREPGGPLCVIAEAVDPSGESALEDVAVVMREVVRRTGAAGEPMFFDGHVTDPHYPLVLATIPHVTGAGLQLLRFG